MTSSRPYLIRALYDWIVENQCTPHLLVDAVAPGTRVPTKYVEDGKIVLNVAPRAVAGLRLDNDWITFSARFGGAPMEVAVPVGAVLAIYARENGQGMMFTAEGGGDEPPPAPAQPDSRTGRPSLKVVK